MADKIDVIFPAICLAVALAFLIQIKDLAIGKVIPQPLYKEAPRNKVITANEITPDYALLRRKITYGEASLHDVHRALTDTNLMGLCNTIHALYGMRIHRGVIHALDGLWNLDKEKYPDFAWENISNPAARIAVASTQNRIKIVRTDEYLSFIRSQKNSGQTFHRAQVAIALGLNGDRQDLAYLADQANGQDHYVAQSAITALSLFGGNTARDTMIQLAEQHGDTERGLFIRKMLRTAYSWPPADLNPLSK